MDRNKVSVKAGQNPSATITMKATESKTVIYKSPVPLCTQCQQRLICPFFDLAIEGDDHISKSVVTHYRPGRYIFYEQEPSTGLYVVCKGAAAVTVSDVHGREYVTQLSGRGGFLNVADVLSEVRRNSVSAKALTETTIAFFKTELLQQEIDKTPIRALKLLKTMAAEMQSLGQRVLSVRSHHADIRVVRSLLELAQLAEAQNFPSKVAIPFEVSRSLLSQLSWTAEETVSRVTTELERRRLISRQHGIITILHMANLSEFRTKSIMDKHSGKTYSPERHKRDIEGNTEKHIAPNPARKKKSKLTAREPKLRRGIDIVFGE